jgi:hypothetical protein
MNKLTHMVSRQFPESDLNPTTSVDPKQLLNISENQSLQENKATLDFAIAISSLSVFRYITDVVSDVSITTLTRIVNVNDMICSLVLLVENAPWIRRRKNKKGMVTYSRFENASWAEVDVEELSRVGKVEAQVGIKRGV